MKTKTLPRPDHVLRPSESLEDCDALMISLASERIVIVRRGDPIRIWSVDQLCKPVRQFRTDDLVYYNNKKDRVRAIVVY